MKKKFCHQTQNLLRLNTILIDEKGTEGGNKGMTVEQLASLILTIM